MKLKDGEGGKTIENFEKLYSLIRPVNIRLYKPKREKRTTISRLKTAWVASHRRVLHITAAGAT